MPVLKRIIEPKNVSRGIVSSEILNELECVSNSTLCNIILQLSSLSKHSEDIFGELHRETCYVLYRTSHLNERIENLKTRIVRLNPIEEEVSLHDINTRKPFRSSVIKDHQMIRVNTRPQAILEVYNQVEPPPALHKLNPYREDSKDSMRFYTDPGYFFELWSQEITKDTETQIKKKKNHKGRGVIPTKDPHTIRTPKSHRDNLKDVRLGPEFVDRIRADNVTSTMTQDKKKKIERSTSSAVEERQKLHHSNSSVLPNHARNETPSQVSEEMNIQETKKLEKINLKTLTGQAVEMPSSPPPPLPSVPHSFNQGQGYPPAVQQEMNSLIVASLLRASSPKTDASSCYNQQQVVASPSSASASSANAKQRDSPKGRWTRDSMDLPPPPSPPAIELTMTYESIVSPPSIPPPFVEFPGGSSSPLPLSPLLPPPFYGGLQTFEFPETNDDVTDLVPPLREAEEEEEENVRMKNAMDTEDGRKTSSSSKEDEKRDNRSDLLAAIKKGIQLRKVEERRLQKKKNPRSLDVQSIMEAAFELRRKALEEDDDDDDDDDEVTENKWSDDD